MPPAGPARAGQAFKDLSSGKDARLIQTADEGEKSDGDATFMGRERYRALLPLPGVPRRGSKSITTAQNVIRNSRPLAAPPARNAVEGTSS